MKSKLYYLVIFLLISCGTTNTSVIVPRELVKDITGDCSTKQKGNYIFSNLTNEQIEVVIWNNPGKMGDGNFPHSITILSKTAQTMYDLEPGIYAFEIRRFSIMGDNIGNGQFKVEICKEKTYNHF